MKKLLAIALFISFGMMNAQSNDNTTSEPEYKADNLIFNEKDNSLQLIGNVNFKSEILEFENAEKVVWNKSSNEIIVSGLKKFSIDGSIQYSDNSDKKILRYKLGSKVAFIE